MTNHIGSLIIDLQNHQLTQEEREIINHPLVGGIILFARNYESRQQLNALCADIKQTRHKPCLIMVDQEGGRVQRFITDFTRLPFMSAFGQLYDTDPKLGIKIAKECGWLMATELLAAAIDLSLAPVLDLNKGINHAIGERAFHAQPDVVATLAKSYIAGMKAAGMAACAKHFPGHGSVSIDSHHGLPIDERTLQDIWQHDLQPFELVIKSGLPAIMGAHIIFQEIDPHPVSYSRKWLHHILRQQLNFEGLILSDDLNMEGANISSHYRDRIVAAKDAGCDFTLLCNNRQGVIEVLNELPAESYQIPAERWMNLRAHFNPKDEYISLPRWQKINAILSKFSGQSPSSWQQLQPELLSWDKQHANDN